jgi:hypothetical protein
MRDRSGIKCLWFAHPLRHEPFLTRCGHEAIMGLATVMGLCSHSGPLSVERVIGIVDDNVLTVMMGSLQVLCSAARSGS